MATRRQAPRQERPITEESARLAQIRAMRERLEFASEAVEALENLDGKVHMPLPDEFFASLQDMKERAEEELRNGIDGDVRDEMIEEGASEEFAKMAQRIVNGLYFKKVDAVVAELSNAIDSIVEEMQKDANDHGMAWLQEGAESDRAHMTQELMALEHSFMNTYRRRTAAA